MECVDRVLKGIFVSDVTYRQIQGDGHLCRDL